MNKELFDNLNHFSEEFDNFVPDIVKKVTDDGYDMIDVIFENLSEILTIDGIIYLVASTLMPDGSGTIASKIYNEDTGPNLLTFRMKVHSSYHKDPLHNDFDNADFGIGLTLDIMDEIAKQSIKYDGDISSLVNDWMIFNNRSEINFITTKLKVEVEQGYYLDDLNK